MCPPRLLPPLQAPLAREPAPGPPNPSAAAPLPREPDRAARLRAASPPAPPRAARASPSSVASPPERSPRSAVLRPLASSPAAASRPAAVLPRRRRPLAPPPLRVVSCLPCRSPPRRRSLPSPEFVLRPDPVKWDQIHPLIDPNTRAPSRFSPSRVVPVQFPRGGFSSKS
nr:vegetative cell wall protein gp1-like [Aegilops tauschii subsp. strangulata]